MRAQPVLNVKGPSILVLSERWDHFPMLFSTSFKRGQDFILDHSVDSRKDVHLYIEYFRMIG